MAGSIEFAIDTCSRTLQARFVQALKRIKNLFNGVHTPLNSLHSPIYSKPLKGAQDCVRGHYHDDCSGGMGTGGNELGDPQVPTSQLLGQRSLKSRR